MELQKMVGQKIFKQLDDGSYSILRIVYVRKYVDGGTPSEITVRDEKTKENKKVRLDSLKGYSPLEPDGIITFAIVTVRDENNKIHKDVIVTGSKYLNLKYGDKMPFCVCRQSITDFFYNLICKGEDDMLVGLSVNQNDCPSNFDFRVTLACESIEYSDYINFYRNDTLEEIFTLFNTNKYDKVLSDLFNEYMIASGNTQDLFKNSSGGWCNDLKTLLYQNNFQNDLNEMLGITDVEFALDNFIIEDKLPSSGETYHTITKELKYWLSSIYKLNFNNVSIIEYNHDINLGEFNNTRYLLLRDSNKKLYLLVYTLNGEYKEADLKALDLDASKIDQFRIKFYNKYVNI